MPMGALNLAPTLVVMMLALQKKWNKLAEEGKIECCGSKVIVDDVILYGWAPASLLQYFRAVLEILKHHRAMIKLQKCKWFHEWCEFVGVDIKSNGNSPAESKYKVFLELECPR